MFYLPYLSFISLIQRFPSPKLNIRAQGKSFFLLNGVQKLRSYTVYVKLIQEKKCIFENINPTHGNVATDGNLPRDHGCCFLLKAIYIWTSSRSMIRRKMKIPTRICGVH